MVGVFFGLQVLDGFGHFAVFVEQGAAQRFLVHVVQVARGDLQGGWVDDYSEDKKDGEREMAIF